MDASHLHLASVRFGLIIESAELALAGLSERERFAERIARQRPRAPRALPAIRPAPARG